MKIDISIIIVNYNVQYFIEQCLNSIFEVSHFDGNFEVIVVDNNSSDGSISLIKEKFPAVQLIENKENVGFSVANNQGLRIAGGTYNLLLNPDTIVEEGTLQQCFHAMEQDLNIGVIGVKMVDGAGQFLPESKRGFPSPSASFYRFSGLYKLFPKSARINAYYQGHIGENEKAEIEILCGAFMFIRKEVLDKIGLLDEAFFMYGEDIDLSYRISEAGYKILYFPQTTIIHFKGESTRKNSIAYTKRFYRAMDIFANKHFKDSKAAIFVKYLSVVITLKAILNLVKTAISELLLPVIDAVLLFFGLHMIAAFWAKFYFKDPTYYDSAPLSINFIIYTIVWIIAIFYGGGYDKKINLQRLARNLVIGTIVILAIYGLLDPAYRSSRAIIVIATVYSLLIVTLIRFLGGLIGAVKFDGEYDRKNLLIIAGPKEALQIEEVLKLSNSSFNKIQRLPVDISIYELRELIRLNGVDEVVCNIKDVGMRRVIELMSALGDKVSFKITGDESLGIIGSKSKNKSGEIYTIQIKYAIQDQNKVRNKRTFDIITTILTILFFPILILLHSTRKILKSALSVFSGQKTIIGYDENETINQRLPIVGVPVLKISEDLAVDYARNYTVWKDFRYLWKSFTRDNG